MHSRVIICSCGIKHATFVFVVVFSLFYLGWLRVSFFVEKILKIFYILYVIIVEKLKFMSEVINLTRGWKTHKTLLVSDVKVFYFWTCLHFTAYNPNFPLVLLWAYSHKHLFKCEYSMERLQNFSKTVKFYCLTLVVYCTLENQMSS